MYFFIFFLEVITKETSKLFFSEKAQELMKQLTGLNIAKIYRTRTIEGKTLPSLHKFMTTEQLRHVCILNVYKIIVININYFHNMLLFINTGSSRSH